MSSQKQLKTKLHKIGGRVTPQRLAVLQIMRASSGQHLSVDEIYTRLGQKVSLATVHRTVLKLEQMGFLTKIYLQDGSKYEMKLSNEKHGHHHLVCQGCGSVVEFKNDTLEELETQITQQYNFSIISHDLQFFGLCNKCKPA